MNEMLRKFKQLNTRCVVFITTPASAFEAAGGQLTVIEFFDTGHQELMDSPQPPYQSTIE